jgi:hypothetical protein
MMTFIKVFGFAAKFERWGRVEQVVYAIAHRRWWLGGGYDVLQGPGWPYKLAWFRDRRHAEMFLEIFRPSHATFWKPPDNV